jgi:hypothetical protein
MVLADEHKEASTPISTSIAGGSSSKKESITRKEAV